MRVNKIKLKTAYKNNHLSIFTFLKLHTMKMGQHFLGHLLLINVVSNDY